MAVAPDEVSGRIPTRSPKGRAAVALANDQHLALPGQESTAALVKRIAAKLLELDREIKDIDKTIAERFRDFPYARVDGFLRLTRFGSRKIDPLGIPGVCCNATLQRSVPDSRYEFPPPSLGTCSRPPDRNHGRSEAPEPASGNRLLQKSDLYQEGRLVMEVVATGFGDPSVLKIVPTDEVAPKRGEVAIEVRAAGVNHVDYMRYADPAGARKHGEGDNPFPMKLGVEVSGVVTAVGDDAHGPAGPIVVGDAVIAYRVSGGYTDRLVAPSSAVVPKPTALSWTQAAVMMLDGTLPSPKPL